MLQVLQIICNSDNKWSWILNLDRLKMHEERKTKKRNKDEVPEGAVPAYLLDR